MIEYNDDSNVWKSDPVVGVSQFLIVSNFDYIEQLNGREYYGQRILPCQLKSSCNLACKSHDIFGTQIIYIQIRLTQWI